MSFPRLLESSTSTTSFLASFLDYFYLWQVRIGTKKFITWIVFLFLFTTGIFYLFLKIPVIPEFNETIQPIWNSDEWLYDFGGFKLFSLDPHAYNASGRFLQILGAVGCLNLFFGIIYSAKKSLLGWITLSPVILLLYPPFSITLSYLLETYNVLIVFHRVLFAIPQGFCLLYFLQNVISNRAELRGKANLLKYQSQHPSLFY